MIDFHSECNVAALIVPATYGADTTPVPVDLAGFDGAEIILAIGAGGITFSSTNKVEFVLTHSDDGVTFANVTTADMLGVTVTDGIIRALIAAHAAASVARYGYVGNKRYVQLLANFSGTHGTGTPISAHVLRTAARVRPVA